MFIDYSGEWPDWGLLANGAIVIGAGILAIAAVVATGGTAAPLVAVGLAAVATSGSVCVITGSYNVYESFSGTNILKDSIGQSSYSELQTVSLLTSVVGAEWAMTQQATSGNIVTSGNTTRRSTAANGNITGYREHGINQAISRDGVGVKPSAILETLKNPISLIESTDTFGRISIKYIGEQSIVVLNEYGELITCWATNSKYWRCR
jgi:hypothetical protein